MGPLAKGLSSIIGLGTEAYAHQKDKRAASGQSSEPPSGQPPPYDSTYEQKGPSNELDEDSGSDYGSDEEDDELDWLRDDTQAQLEPARSQDGTEEQKTVDQITAEFTAHHQLPDGWRPPHGGLPMPVILPQRRPGSKFRGFVHAYAPPLHDCGIDQATWFDFLDGFEKAINKQGWFHTVNAAVALGAMAYHIATLSPNIVLRFVIMSVHIAIESGRRVYMSKKTNSFLDTMNAEFFQPRGLYALVMQYKPSSKVDDKAMDANNTTNYAVGKRVGDDKSKMQDYHSASGKVLEQQIPECCPLVFPKLEKATDEQKQNAMKRAGHWYREYTDRRSEAKFEGSNPGSRLNISDPNQKKGFASQYSDPNSAVNRGGLIGVLTGGKIDPKSRRMARRNKVRMKIGRKPKDPNKQRGMKRLLVENVLYLMVVNMPTAEELAAAKELEEQLKKEQPGWWEKATLTVKNMF